MHALLEITDVVQRFRSGFWLKEVEVLHGVSLTVPRGSIYGFLGANGAGKTTLIQLIVGIREPVSGSVLLNGIPTQKKEARAQIGYLPERPYFHEHLTGKEFLEYFGVLSGMSRTLLQKRIPEALASVGMTRALDLELKKFSKGMLQRIGIAQAILHDPPFLVLDEPMSGLDPVGRKEIRELILDLAKNGKTIFFSSHVIPDVEALCDQVALIQGGKIVSAGPVAHLLGGEASRCEISFRGITLEQIKQSAGLSVLRDLRSLPQEISAFCDPGDQLNSVMRELMAQKAEIISVVPVRPSLESYFS